MPVEPREIRRFGPYEIRSHTRELLKGGVRLKLRPQPFRILEILVRHASEVVTRDELRLALWPRETFVDFEHGLNTSIKELRRALCDSPDQPRYIETVPRIGYRLIAPVEHPPIVPEPAGGTPAANHGRLARRLERWIPAGAALVAIAIAATWLLRWEQLRSSNQATERRVMLAVLPFENLTGDLSQDYLSDGLTEEMIAQLGQISPSHLGVIARTSVMRYKRTTQRVDQIGRDLGVEYVLEGSLRRDAGRVRVSARLIRVNDETPAWTKEYDREFSSLLAVQSEIAHSIAGELQLALADRRVVGSGARSAEQSQAYELYLKGLYFWNKRTTLDFERAIGLFQQAIVLDPHSAASYAGLADCYALLGGYRAEPRPEYTVEARSAALRALDLDPNLPEAHTALAVIVQNYDHDWRRAGNEFRRAIELNPSYATAHQWYAEHLGYLGRFEEAFRESERARQLDPLSLIVATDNSTLLVYARQYDRAVARCRDAQSLDPNFGPASGCLARVYTTMGKFAEALEILEPTTRAYAEQAANWTMLAYCYGRIGRKQQARQALENAKLHYHPGQTDPAVFVDAYLGIGDKEEALKWLEASYRSHSNRITILKVDPILDPLRGDARFEDLVHQAGLSQ